MEYKKKQRPQKIKMLDGAIKTILVDDSKTVGELLVTICSRIGARPSPNTHRPLWFQSMASKAPLIKTQVFVHSRQPDDILITVC